MLIRQAKTYEDFMAVRQIRNEVRRRMTNNQKEISWWGQARFYLRYKYEHNQVLYVMDNYDKEIIGYGLIRYIDGKAWITGAIARGFRGMGYGEELFQFLSQDPSRPLCLDVLSVNIEGLNLYRKLGFVEVSRNQGKYGETITMQKENGKSNL